MASTSNNGGTVSANPTGGNDISVHAVRSIGDTNANAAVGVFAKGNDFKGPVTTGAFAEANS